MRGSRNYGTLLKNVARKPIIRAEGADAVIKAITETVYNRRKGLGLASFPNYGDRYGEVVIDGCYHSSHVAMSISTKSMARKEMGKQREQD